MRSMLMLFIALACHQVSLASAIAPRCSKEDKPDDCKALCDLYNATNGPAWTKNEGWVDGCAGKLAPKLGTVCEWTGVTCKSLLGKAGYAVSQVTVFNNNLMGTIPSSIGKLKYLNQLDLSFNQLMGTIPSTIGQLTELTDLALDRNALTGTIPDSIGKLTALAHLLLLQNMLTGTIPASISKLTALTSMELHNNQLTGPIPDDHGWKELTKLTYLDLSFNHFSSWTGHGFCNVTDPYLTDCKMNNNSFACPLPACAAACKATCETPRPSPSPTPLHSNSNVLTVVAVVSGICGAAIIGTYMFTRRSGAAEQQADAEEDTPYALVEPGQEARPAPRPAQSRIVADGKVPYQTHDQTKDAYGLNSNLLAGTTPDPIERRNTDDVL